MRERLGHRIIARDRQVMGCLRAHGFVRTDTDTNAGHGIYAMYELRVPACRRVLEVRLERDGSHSVTHMLYRDAEMRLGRMTTMSTPFRNVTELCRGIVTELTRTDQQP